jgi:hypothetical protein
MHEVENIDTILELPREVERARRSENKHGKKKTEKWRFLAMVSFFGSVHHGRPFELRT